MIPLDSSALLTDLYQLTMLYGYFRHGMEAPAVFELFVRKLPPGRNFLMAAGLDQVVEYLHVAPALIELARRVDERTG